jgi:hypothetical protein
MSPDQKLGSMLLALRVSASTPLPSKHWDGVDTVKALISACSQRYKSVRLPLNGRKLENVLNGYYFVSEDKKVLQRG